MMARRHSCRDDQAEKKPLNNSMKKELNRLFCLVTFLAIWSMLGLMVYHHLYTKSAMDQLTGNRGSSNDNLSKLDTIRKSLVDLEDSLLRFVPCQSGYFRIRGEHCTKGSMLMKLKGVSSTFHYHSSYWTNSETLNEHEIEGSNNDNIDAKLAAFNTLAFSKMLVCYKTLNNCYKYNLGETVSSARVLFSGGFRSSIDLGGGGGKKKWTDLFLPSEDPHYQTFWNGGSGTDCNMTRPGINTICDPHDVSARIGYCLDSPGDVCGSVSAHLDAVIGIGLKNVGDPKKMNAPYGGYAVYDQKTAPTHVYQAWIIALQD